MNILNYFAGLAGMLALMPIVGASTVFAGADEFALCAKKYHEDDVARLKCYDKVAAPILLQTEVFQTIGRNSSLPIEESNNVPSFDVGKYASVNRAEQSYLTRAWHLGDMKNRGPGKLGRLIPHRQNYLIIKKSNNLNNFPSSPAAAHSMLTTNDLDAMETKFQFSFKADIGSKSEIDFWGLKSLRFWGAYTQQSNWQMFNARNSSPFRETNYEPELIASFGTGNDSGLKLVNLGWSHQSNGQTLPGSRSWNRVYLQGGWEKGNVSVMARGWWRIPENILKDDNPDISDYIGRADMALRWEPNDKSQAVALLLRNNLSIVNNRGFLQLDWSMPLPLGNSARMHAQLTSGVGESLIDYNHRQTTLGVGFSFREW